jgi:hypothetical protein
LGWRRGREASRRPDDGAMAELFSRIWTDDMEARVGDYPLISDIGLVGDLQTSALVTKDGTIDFFCAPRFDSPKHLRLASRCAEGRALPDRTEPRRLHDHADVPPPLGLPGHPVHERHRGWRADRFHAHRQPYGRHHQPQDRPRCPVSAGSVAVPIGVRASFRLRPPEPQALPHKEGSAVSGEWAGGRTARCRRRPKIWGYGYLP